MAYFKWKEGYKCVKCGNVVSQVRKDHSRTCKISAVSQNQPWLIPYFHKVKFGIRKAFFICFEMSTTTESLSTSYMAERFGITEKTARLFMHKVREAMKSSETHLIEGNVHIDEFVIGGKEESKIGRSYDS